VDGVLSAGGDEGFDEPVGVGVVFGPEGGPVDCPSAEFAAGFAAVGEGGDVVLFDEAGPVGELEGGAAESERTGAEGNALVISYGAYRKLTKNAKIQSQYRALMQFKDAKAATALEISADALATIFGLDKVIIARAIKNTADEGQTASRDYVWASTYAGLFRISKGGPTANELAFGRMFSYSPAEYRTDITTGTLDSQRSLIMEMYPDANVNAEILRCRDYVDLTILAPEAFQLIKST
jgi:hypothetical protein